MQSIMDWVNDPPPGQSALVIGALTSFAFVFVHPFMDGNGRLSRFLFHKAVCQSEALQQVSLTAVMEPPMFGVMEPRTGS